jgi:hypothetical protein
MIFRGVVKRYSGRSVTDGFVFNMLTNDGFDTKVNASHSVISSLPPNGSVLSVVGDQVRGAEAWEIHATHVSIALPEGDEIVELIAHHPMFRTVDWRLAKRLWRKLRQGLYQALNNWDKDESLSSLLPPWVAKKLLLSWHNYASKVEFHKALRKYSLPSSVEQTFWSLYGPEAIALFMAAPYRIADLMPWHQADAICALLVDPAAATSSRNVAAVHHVLEGARLDGRYWLPIPELLSATAELLGPTQSPDLALSEATNSRVCEEIALFETNVVASRTLANMYHRVFEEFGCAASSEASPRPKGQTSDIVIHSALELVNAVRIGRRSLITAPQRAHGALAELHMRDLVHITPLLRNPASQASEHSNTFSFADALRGLPQTLLRNSNIVVLIHMGHLLDLICLNKLISVLPPTWSICVLGDNGMESASAGGQIFELLHQRQSRLLQLAPSFGDVGPSWATNDSIPNQLECAVEAQPAWSQASKLVPLESMPSVVRATFLKAADSGAAIIVTETVAFAKIINELLQLETQATRDYLKQDTTTITLPNGQKAGVGDPLVYGGQDLSRALLRGATGQLTAIYELPKFVMTADGSTNVFVAEASFDTAGSVTVTLSDLAHLSLGYAIPHSTKLYREFSEAVCVLECSSNQMMATLRTAHHISNHCLVIKNSAPTSPNQLH